MSHNDHARKAKERDKSLRMDMLHARERTEEHRIAARVGHGHIRCGERLGLSMARAVEAIQKRPKGVREIARQNAMREDEAFALYEFNMRGAPLAYVVWDRRRGKKFVVTVLTPEQFAANWRRRGAGFVSRFLVPQESILALKVNAHLQKEISE